MKKRHYSKSFKSEAVKLSYERANIKELASELGISAERIYKWRSDQRDSVSKKHPSNRTTTTTKEEELRRLKKELKETRLELAILKKAVHIFSKSDGNSMNL